MLANKQLMEVMAGNYTENMLEYETTEGTKTVTSGLMKYLNVAYGMDKPFIRLMYFILKHDKKLSGFRLSPYFHLDLEDIISSGYVAYLEASQAKSDDEYHVYKQTANAARRYLSNKYKSLSLKKQNQLLWLKADQTNWAEVLGDLALDLGGLNAKDLVILDEKLNRNRYPRNVGGVQIKAFKAKIKDILLPGDEPTIKAPATEKLYI